MVYVLAGVLAVGIILIFVALASEGRSTRSRLG